MGFFDYFNIVLTFLLFCTILLIFWLLRFRLLKYATYFLRRLRYKTPYLLAFLYGAGGFLDNKLHDLIRCYLYAKEDGLHIITMDRLIPTKYTMAYEKIISIYIEPGLEDEDFQIILDQEPLDKYYPTYNNVPETIIIMFLDNTGKQQLLRMEMTGYSATNYTEDFNKLTLYSHNIFAYILPKMPNCTFYQYKNGRSIDTAKPYPKLDK